MKKTAYFTGAAAIVVTILVFLLVCKSFFKLPICMLALLFIVLSEALTTAGFAFAAGNPKKVGAAFALLINTVITVVLAIVFCNIFFFALGWYIALNLIFFAVFIGIGFAIHNFAEHSANVNAEFNAAKNFMHENRAAVQSLINNSAYAEYHEQLLKLDEKLHFSDDSVTDLSDADIRNAITVLKNNIASPDYNTSAEIDKLINMIEQRNFIVKAKKANKPE